jgi:FKBP-type peptidyl-prolyl cis-trans isomerase 2
MKASSGNRVKVSYTLKTSTGEVVETTSEGNPLVFTLGDKKLIFGFEQGVLGMEPGESRIISIPAAEAYGLRDERLVFEFDRNRAPESFDPCIGQQIRMNRPDGGSFVATVMKRTEKGFMMDANHPLAGEDLTFDLQLLEIIS